MRHRGATGEVPGRTVLLTIRNVPTLRADGKETLFWDRQLPGFYLAVYPPSKRFPKGVRSYGVWYRVRGRRRQKRLGRHPTVGLAAAREQARTIMEAARVRRVDLGGAPSGRTLTDIVTAFIDASEKRKPRRHADSTLGHYRQQLQAYIRPAPAGGISLDELVARDLTAMLTDVAAETPVTANRVLQLIRAAVRWAMKAGITDRDPTFAVEPPADEGGGRERALRDDELLILWRACVAEIADEKTMQGADRGPRERTEEERASGAQRSVLARLILLTGARPGEAQWLEWPEIEKGAGLWHVPSKHRKGQRGISRAHIFPLSAQALETLDELVPVTGGRRRAFPAWLHPYEPHWVDPLRERARRMGLDDTWTPHDLRRTCSTGLARLGYTRAQIAIVLGHTVQEGGAVTGVYDRFDRMPERAAALEAWGKHVAALVLGRG